MARIKGVSEQDTPEEVKVALQQMRSWANQMTGQKIERGVEPLEIYAHAPAQFAAMVAFSQAAGHVTGIDKRIQALAHLKAATMTHCAYCIDIGSYMSRQSGLTDEELLALPNYRTSPLFSEVEKLVLDYAVGMSRTPVDVPDELFDALKKHFDEKQLVELTHVIATENMYGRFNHALGVGAAGFSEGMVCAVPAGAAA
jgi:AhpD family alkylhydroperoxidase